MLLTSTYVQNFLGALAGQKSSSVSFGASGNCWLGLFTSYPGDNAESAAAYELSGNGYGRVNIKDFLSNTYKSYNASSASTWARRIGNKTQIAFPEALDPDHPDDSSYGSWSTVTHFGMFTSSTNGSPFAWGPLSSAVSVSAHRVLVFRSGNFQIHMEDT